MFKYKTELHCHTLESSPCGKVSAKDFVNTYIEKGYNTLVITDHFTKDFCDKNHFLKGYYAAKEAGKGKINVILGMEYRSPAFRNDYLIYGDIEKFLSKDLDLINIELNDFINLAHENSLLVYQAHPFRNSMTVLKPDLLDGIEVYNAHPRHDSRNFLAYSFAKHYGKKMISGSDAHQVPDPARSGILTETEIKNHIDLLSVLKSENYKLITLED